MDFDIPIPIAAYKMDYNQAQNGWHIDRTETNCLFGNGLDEAYVIEVFPGEYIRWHPGMDSASILNFVKTDETYINSWCLAEYDNKWFFCLSYTISTHFNPYPPYENKIWMVSNWKDRTQQYMPYTCKVFPLLDVTEGIDLPINEFREKYIDKIHNILADKEAVLNIIEIDETFHQFRYFPYESSDMYINTLYNICPAKKPRLFKAQHLVYPIRHDIAHAKNIDHNGITFLVKDHYDKHPSGYTILPENSGKYPLKYYMGHDLEDRPTSPEKYDCSLVNDVVDTCFSKHVIVSFERIKMYVHFISMNDNGKQQVYINDIAIAKEVDPVTRTTYILDRTHSIDVMKLVDKLSSGQFRNLEHGI